jgi:type 1 fimbria pilin
MKKVILMVSLVTVIFSSVAMAQGSGTIISSGSIIQTHSQCALAPESVEQVINLGQIADSTLAENEGTGSSARRQFMIKLNDCEVGPQGTVTVVFGGIAGKDGRLAINGEASGASIAINDINDEPLPLGAESQPIKLLPRNNVLVFSLYLQGDGVVENINAGDYQAVASYTLSYN